MTLIAVIGPGAVGAVIAYELGAVLFGRENSNVTLTIDQTTVSLNVTALQTNQQTFDYIFVAVKSTQMTNIIPALEKMYRHNSKVILCQNGIGQEEQTTIPVIPAVVYISGQKTDTTVHHFRDKKLIVPADHNLDHLLQLTSCTNLTILESPDFRHERMFKLLVNLGINTITGLTKNTVHVLELPEINQLTRRILEEGITIARHENIMFDADIVDSIMKIYDGYPSHMGTSMYYDILNKQLTEYEYIQGTMLKLARKHQLAVPVIELTTTLLKGYQYKKK